MALGTLSISGLVSGFDTDGMIAKLTELQQKPIQQLEAQKVDLNKKLTSFLDFNTRLLALKTRADKLSSDSLYEARTATTSDSSVFTVSATPGEDVGTFTLSVEQLATQHQVISQGFASASTQVGQGTVSISVGAVSFDPIVIDSGNQTLAGLRDAINEAEIGVRASIFDDGSGATGQRLVLSSLTTGSDGQIAVSFNLNGGTTPAVSDLQVAQDARIRLGTGGNAVEVTSSENTFTSLIPGVTLNLVKADPGVAKTLNVASDRGAARKAVEDTLTTYNQLNTFFRDQARYDETTKSTGILFGNRTVQAVRARLSAALTQPANVGGEYRSLGEIGISVDSLGALSVSDPAAFEQALKNPEDLQKLFNDETNGLVTRLNRELERATDVVNGSVTVASSTIEKQIEGLSETEALLKARAKRTEDNLLAQFVALESALSTMQSQSSRVAAQLSSLAELNLSKKKK